MEFFSNGKRLIKKGVVSLSIISSFIATSVFAEPAQRFIIKYKDDSLVKASRVDRVNEMMQHLASRSGLPISHVREMAMANRHVLKLTKKHPRSQFIAMMKLLANDSNVISIEEDVLMQPNLVPDDTFYNLQWHYFEPTGGMNAEQAWDTNDGNGVVVAVIDTGITDHTDLNANVLPGYDFIDDLSVANDGDGRDADASDPGDWVDDFECGFNFASGSSWHGTHTAGTVAALTNNGQGVAGVAYGAQILPVRVLGKCGGFLSDIADAIIWASGGTVAGVPDNTTPAQVINMSLGGGGDCDATYQDAIDIAVANGTTVVVSAGNSTADAIDFRPANCNGVITVAANDREGNLASYSNFGATVDVTAPGGETEVAENGVASTLNDGAEGPGAETYVYYQGTSMAAPHVAGAAALLYQANPSITPAEVESVLMSTARPMPGECAGGCGAGIIDARAALDALGTPTNVAPTAAFSSSVSGSQANFTDSSTDTDGTIASWSWTFGDGGTSTAQNPVYTYGADGTYDVTLTVTDDDGDSDSVTQSVVINASNVVPTSGFSFSTNGLQVAFTDSSFDDDGTISSYNWNFGDGNTSTEQNPTYTYAASGTYTVELTVTDNDGANDVSNQAVTVEAPNVAPTSSFTFVANNLSVDFSDLSSDSDGSLTNWSWDFGDGNTSSQQNPNNIYAAAGSYTVSLEVTDNEGATNSSTQIVTVTDPGNVTSGGFTEVGLSPSSGEILSYTIDVPSGASSLEISTSGGTGNVDLAVNFGSTPTVANSDCLERAAGNEHTCSFTNPSEGTWFIIVRGAAASTNAQLDAYWFADTPGNLAPTSAFSSSANLLEASFVDASTDSDGSIAAWLWDFGDGNTSTLQNPTNTYAASGTYSVTLTVTDDNGATNSSTQSITVSDGNSTSDGFTQIVAPNTGELLSFTIDVPAGADLLEVSLSGGTGNADLAINFGSPPTFANNECLENGAGNEHTCSVTNPQEGTWFIIVRGASAASDVQLDAYWFDN